MKRNTLNKSEEIRNWIDLPRELMLQIFLKLGAISVLYRAQSVCSSWREIAKDPELYRTVDMRDSVNYFDTYELNNKVAKMAIEAIDRSCGQLVEFSIMYFATDQVLHHLVEKECPLKSLRLVACHMISEDALTDILKKLTVLEEFQVYGCRYMDTAIKVAGSCPQLTSFGLNRPVLQSPSDHPMNEYNGEAYMIAHHLPHIRRLHLFGNWLNTGGLRVILNSCPKLEYLDLRQCYKVKLKGDQLEKSSGIKEVRHPYDSIEDYEFNTRIDYSWWSDDEFDYLDD